MNNAVYGKNCELKLRRIKIELTRKARRTLIIVEFDKFKVFGENMAALSSPPKKDLLGYTNYSRGHNT